MNGVDMKLRAGLALLGFCWLGVGIAYLEMSTARRWHPEAIGILGIGAAAATLALAVWPWLSVAYRLAGTLGVGGLTARVLAVGMGLFQSNDTDAMWIVLASVCTTLPMAGLYWHWWLSDVQRWHMQHKRVGRR